MRLIIGMGAALVLLFTLASEATVQAQPEHDCVHGETTYGSVYAVLNAYYRYDLERKQLDPCLSQLGAASESGLLSGLHQEGRPIPTRLLFDSTDDSLVSRYTQKGQSIPCGGERMPGMTYDQAASGLTYLCNESTGEWTLFQRPVMPAASTWGNPVRITESYCFYDHPTYQGTLTLLRGILNCPAQ